MSSFRAAIIGAGGSGIYTAYELEQKGVDYTVFEANTTVGGTWVNNNYPGIACDVKAPLYGFSFNPIQSDQQQPSGGELQKYFEDTAKKIGMFPKIRFSTKVVDATWDSALRQWIIIDSNGGKESFNALISACGQLNVPNKPNITGASDFKGIQVHSTDWDSTLNVTDKRIGVVGSGPTAAQIIPAVAKMKGTQLTAFQRTVPYILPLPYAAYSEEDKKKRKEDPSIIEKEIEEQFAAMEALYGAMLNNSAGQVMVSQMCCDFLKNAIKGSKVEMSAFPSYACGVKRICVSPITNEDGTATKYTDALLKDNVELVRSTIDQLEINGVRTADGKLHELDILVYATGFKSQTFVNTPITGPKGTLVDAWAGEPKGYYGIMVPDFPNFFMVYGPGTNLGHNSVLTMSDAQRKFIGKAVDAIKDSCGTIEVTVGALNAYYEVHQASIAKTCWAVDGVNNWYKGANGVVVNNCGTNVADYKRHVEEAGNNLANTMIIDGKAGSFQIQDMPGRLGNPLRDASTDPRVDPRLQLQLKSLGIHVGAKPLTDPRSPVSELTHAWATGTETAFNGLLTAVYTQIAPLPELKVEHHTICINGRDGNEIKLFISRPADESGPLPCVVHMHGGGFALFSNNLINFVRWRDELASRGIVAIGVEMRNTSGALGNTPFPGPLHDCVDGLKYVLNNKAFLQVSNVFTNGESAGGNLSIATALSLKQEGIAGVSGIFASCPMLSNLYHMPEEAKSLSSLRSNSGYFMSNEVLAVMADLYTQGGADDRNPLAWPYWATEEDLKGLPPVIISLNECDPLFSEGEALHAKLKQAGVASELRVVTGTTHAAEQYLQGLVGDIADATLDSLAAFVKIGSQFTNGLA